MTNATKCPECGGDMWEIFCNHCDFVAPEPTDCTPPPDAA